MWRALHRLTEGALDLLFPPRCLGCDREGSYLCPDCVASAPWLVPPFCPLCAEPGSERLCPRCMEATPVLEGVRAPFRMEGVAREAVHRLKYSNLRALALPMATPMADALSQTGWRPDWLVPVPLHPRRERERGYNQAYLLARGLHRLTGVPVARALLRTRDMPSQAGTSSRAERIANVQGGFACAGDVAGHRVALVDDVCTTGATLGACAVALKEAGASAVWGLAFAREA